MSKNKSIELFSTIICSNLIHENLGIECSSTDLNTSYKNFFRIIETALHNTEFVISDSVTFNTRFDDTELVAKFIVYINKDILQSEMFSESEVDAYKKYLNSTINNAIKINNLIDETNKTNNNTKYLIDESLNKSGELKYNEDDNIIYMPKKVEEIALEINKISSKETEKEQEIVTGEQKTTLQKTDKIKSQSIIDKTKEKIFRGIVICVNTSEKTFIIDCIINNKKYKADKVVNDDLFQVIRDSNYNDKIIEISCYVKLTRKITMSDTKNVVLVKILSS